MYRQKYIVYRKRKIFAGETGKLDDAALMAYINKHSKEKFLLPVSDVHKDNLSIIEKIGIDYTKAVMYRTVSNDFGPDEAFDYDMLIFFSPAGVDSLMKNFPEFQQGDIVIGCLGSTTAAEIGRASCRERV